MATLSGRTPQNTFGNLIQVDNSNAGLDTTLRPVEDGKGNVTPLKLSTSAVGVGTITDLESAITNAGIVSVTTTASLNSSAFGHLHVFTGSADYTVTLPTANGNSGKTIGLKGANSLNFVVTIDGSGSETIDGWLTKRIVARKQFSLVSDGTNWLVYNESPDKFILYKNNSNSTAITGTTTETLVDSFLIPANTIKPNDRIMIRAEWAKTGTAGAWNLKHRFNTSAAVGGTSIMAPNPASTIISPSTERVIVCKNSQTAQEVLTTSANVNLDLGTAQNTAKTNPAIDFTVDQFIVSTVQVLNAADSGLMSSIVVEVQRG